MAAKDGILGSDERIRKDKRGPVEQRGDLGAAQDAERVNSAGGSMLDPAERRRMLSEWEQRALPQPPDIPGYHTCWLSTTHPTDTVHRRLKVGYILVRKDEVVDFDIEKSVQHGSEQYADYVMCNEMVLGKIPVELYQDAMALFHHYKPAEEEGAIRSRIAQAQAEVNQEAGRQAVVQDGEGFSTLGVSPKGPPVFHG